MLSLTPLAAIDRVQPLLDAAGRTPVVLITGHQISVAEAQSRGFCTVVRKPFNYDMLLGRIRTCMSGSGFAQ